MSQTSSVDPTQLRHGPIEGSFARYEIPSLLTRIARQGRTGTLDYTAGSRVRRTIGFVNGRVALAESSVAAEWLSARLLEAGKITFEQEADIQELIRGQKVRFGAAMVQMGIMSAEELQRTLQWHYSWLIRRCVACRDIEASFDPEGAAPDDGPKVPLLRCMEDGIRDYRDAVLDVLQQELGGWRFCAEPGELEFARDAGCSQSVSAMLEVAAGGGSWSLRVLAAASEQEQDLVSAVTLVLCGLVASERASEQASDEGSAVPEAKPPGGDESFVPASSEPLAEGPSSDLHASPEGKATEAPKESVPLTEPSAQVPGMEPSGDLWRDDDDVRLPGRFDWLVGLLEGQDGGPKLQISRGRGVIAAFVLFGAGLGVGAGLWSADDNTAAVADVADVAASVGVERAQDARQPEARPPQGGAASVADAPARGSPSPSRRIADQRVTKRLEAGHAFLKRRRLRRAVAEYKKAVALAPNDGRIHRSLGIAYTMLNDPDRAVREYRIYLQLQPDAMDADEIRKMITAYEGQP